MPRPRFAARPIIGNTAVRWIAPLAHLLLGLQGCGFAASPSLPFYGAYFPYWLFCAVLGVLGSVLVRMLLIRLGIDEGIPMRTLVYIALAFLIAFAVAAATFGR